MHRVESSDHTRFVGDVHDADRGNGDEPERHHRTEERRDPGRAARLDGEQADQDDHRQRHHIFLQLRRTDLQAFDRRQHRDGWRDQRIAVEERGGDHAEQHHGVTDAALAERPLRQRHQRQRAAFALVVCPEQDQHIFAGDDEDQRPQDQREHAEHAFVRDDIGWSCRRLERNAEGIKGARADIAKHDAHAAERERPEAVRTHLDVSAIGGRSF